mmetsp:Transcript_131/g.230  ORF Transcript_131/g.230 Transcript_131/m.230 type:complete len:291 (-) Transcript_131:8-880(-)
MAHEVLNKTNREQLRAFHAHEKSRHDTDQPKRNAHTDVTECVLENHRQPSSVFPRNERLGEFEDERSNVTMQSVSDGCAQSNRLGKLDTKRCDDCDPGLREALQRSRELLRVHSSENDTEFTGRKLLLVHLFHIRHAVFICVHHIIALVSFPSRRELLRERFQRRKHLLKTKQPRRFNRLNKNCKCSSEEHQQNPHNHRDEFIGVVRLQPLPHGASFFVRPYRNVINLHHQLRKIDQPRPHILLNLLQIQPAIRLLHRFRHSSTAPLFSRASPHLTARNLPNLPHQTSPC